MHFTMEGHATVKQRDMLESEKKLHENLLITIAQSGK